MVWIFEFQIRLDRPHIWPFVDHNLFESYWQIARLYSALCNNVLWRADHLAELQDPVEKEENGSWRRIDI